MILGVQHGWELVGWREGGNFTMSLSEEQIYAIFDALGIKIVIASDECYEISKYTDEYLKSMMMKRREIK